MNITHSSGIYFNGNVSLNTTIINLAHMSLVKVLSGFFVLLPWCHVQAIVMHLAVDVIQRVKR